MSITAFSFGEWLPDLPDLGNPGLKVAMNLLPIAGGSYAPYAPLSSVSTILALSAIAGLVASGNGSREIYAVGGDVSKTLIYQLSSTNWVTVSSTLPAATNVFSMLQFDDKVFAVQQSAGLLVKTINSVSSFATIASAPAGNFLGIINRFLFVGNAAGGLSLLRWSALNDPTSFPTPNSATAIATQSGQQQMPVEWGSITHIAGGDQHGLVFQEGGITRLTYAGPPVVFQFDRIASLTGAPFYGTVLTVEGLTYFATDVGFFVTDGVQVRSIGDKKVNRYLIDNFEPTSTYRFSVAADMEKRLIYWSVNLSTTPGICGHLMVYNYAEDRWSLATQNAAALFSGAGLFTPNLTVRSIPYAFDGNNRLGQFTGTPGTATIESGEVEPQPGGCALINGIKAVVASSGTAPTIGVQVGSRDDQGTAVSYSSTTTPTSRTGFADFRSDARYHRARVYIAGNFDKALGLEIDATPTGGM